MNKSERAYSANYIYLVLGYDVESIPYEREELDSVRSLIINARWLLWKHGVEVHIDPIADEQRIWDDGRRGLFGE